MQLPYQTGQSYAAGNPNWNPWSYPGAAPNYTPGYDPNTMAVNSDPTALNAFTQQALRSGPSQFATQSSAQQDALNMNARAGAVGSNAGATASADSHLAMTGGLDSGARERVQTQGNRNLMDMNQKVNETTANNKMQIGMNDEQNRISQLGQVPGMQNTQNQAAEYNTSNAINEGNAYNAYKYGVYNSQMKGWAAGQQSNATANSGGGGSWLCTEALPKAEHEKSWEILERFKHYALQKDRVKTMFYLTRCKELVPRMRMARADFRKNREFIQHIVSLCERREYEKAFQLYETQVVRLIHQYWPKCEEPVYLKEAKYGVS